MIDWTKPIETTENTPRPAKVLRVCGNCRATESEKQMSKSNEIVFWVMQYKDGGFTLPVDACGAEALFYHAFPTANRKQFKAVPVHVKKVRRPAREARAK